MKFGLIVDGHWGFIRELRADWQARYETEVFAHSEISLPVSEGRVNQWRLKRALSKFMNANDVVFFEWAGHLSIIGSRLSSKSRLVVRIHSWELYEFAPHICWESVDRIILVSQAMQQKFVALFPEHAAKTRVVNYGKSLDKFEPLPHEFGGHIGMLCDIVPIKRVYDMILTLHELKKKGHLLSLHLAGEPRKGADNERYFVSMQRAVEKLGLQDQVIFYGWVDDVVSWLQKIDIFISNSYWEGQQNALLEAMAVGCYSLSHFWDGAEEILPPQYLYATEAELQQKIIEYCQLPNAEKLRHGVRLRSMIQEKFDVEQMKAQIREVIEELGESR